MTFDLRSGYYHMVLPGEFHAESVFVAPFGKFEFVCFPFGLAQALVYFQCLIFEVLEWKSLLLVI